MLVAFFSTLKLIPAKQRLSLLTQKNHVGIRANDSKSKYRDTVLSIHFYFHLRISENTAKQIITAFHFCVFPKLLHHNATQMPVGLGYLLKAKQCLWSQEHVCEPRWRRTVVQLASVSTSQGIVKFTTGLSIVPSPNDYRITSWY